MPDRRNRLTFAVLATGVALYGLLQSLLAPVLPTVQQHLHTSQNTVTWVITSYLVAASVFTPIMGRVGDMIGKRLILILSFACLAVGLLLAAVATSIGVMIVARVIQGLGGGLLPLAFGVIRDDFPPARVAGAIGALSALLGAGVGAGLVLAGPIENHLGYAWLFLVPMLIGAIGTVAAYLVLPESPGRLPGRIGWPAVLLLTGWLVALLIGVSQAPSWGWLSVEVLGLIALAAVLAAIWVVVETRSEYPLIDMRMMRIPAVWTSNVVALLLGVGLYAAFAFIPQFVQTPPVNGYGFGASVTESGLMTVPQAIAVFVIGLLASGLARRFGAKRLVTTGATIVVVPFLILAFAHSEKWEIVLATGLLGVGIGLVFATLPNIIVGAVPPEQTGVATGMNANIRNIGGAIGTAAVSTIVTSTVQSDGFATEAGYRWGFTMLAITSGITVIACLLIPVAHATPPPQPAAATEAVPAR